MPPTHAVDRAVVVVAGQVVGPSDDGHVTRVKDSGPAALRDLLLRSCHHLVDEVPLRLGLAQRGAIVDLMRHLHLRIHRNHVDV